MPQHLTAEEREDRLQMWFANHSQSEIVRKLNRHRSTISRELARNGDEYCGVIAQRKSEQRRRERPRITKLQSAEAQEYVTSRLKKCVLVAGPDCRSNHGPTNGVRVHIQAHDPGENRREGLGEPVGLDLAGSAALLLGAIGGSCK